MITPLIKHADNLLQCFYIIGLDKTSIFNPKIYKSEHVDLIPSLISKFPYHPLPYMQFPDEIILHHCFPNGFHLEDKTSDKTPKKDFFIFSLDNIAYSNKTQSKVYFTCLLFFESLNDFHEVYTKYIGKEQYEPLATNKYIPKIIALSSFHPFFYGYKKILNEIYTHATNKAIIGIPLEKIIENLIFNLPSPPPGLFKIEYNFLKKPLIFEQSPINHVPLSLIDLEIIFQYFNVNAFLSIFKCLLLEIPLIFFCENKENLSNIIEGLVALMYPFKYLYPVIAILPSNSFSMLQTMKCFIVGINAKYNEALFTEGKIELGDKSVVLVELNESQKVKFTINERIPNVKEPLIYLSQHRLCYVPPEELFKTTDLPLHYKEKILNRIKKYLLNIKEQGVKQNKSVFNNDIQELLVYFIISIILDYQNYLILKDNCLNLQFEKYKQNDLPIENLVRVKDYLNSMPALDYPFYNRFFGTKVFYSFIMKKIFPSSPQEKLEILFVDESIAMKNNKYIRSKKVATQFLQMKKFDEKIQTVAINCSFNKFSKEEKVYLQKKANCQKAIEYNQIINFDSDNICTIKYPIFPKLLYDGVFFDKTPLIELKFNSLYEQFNIECQSIVNNTTLYDELYSTTKYDLSKFTASYYSFLLDLVSQIKIDMRHYITMVWLKMFAMTFWYMKPIEKRIRFNSMIGILTSTQFIEEEIYFLIFLSVCNNGNKQMVIKTFELIPTKNYTLCLLLADRLKQDKNQNDTSLAEYEANNNSFNANSFDKIITQRSFYRNSFQQNKKMEEIVFKTCISCPKCKLNIDFNIGINEIKTMPKQSFDIECSICKKKVSSKMEVLVNKTKIEVFNILTPYQLYNLDWIQSNNQIDVVTFNSQYPDRFWNAMYYFSLMKLPNDFLLPYKESDNVKLFINIFPQHQDDFTIDQIQSSMNLIEGGYDLMSNGPFFEFKSKSLVEKSTIKKTSSDCAVINKKGASTDKLSTDEFKKKKKRLKAHLGIFSPELKSKLGYKVHKSAEFTGFYLGNCGVIPLSNSSSPGKDIK